MSINPRLFAATAVCVFALLPRHSLNGQMCVDLFSNLPMGETMQCADARFDLDVDGFSLASLTGAASGLFQADFDGLGLFDDSGMTGHDNIVSPFLGQVEVAMDGPTNNATGFTVQQQGGVSFTPRDVAFQQGVFGSTSRVSFIPFSDSSNGPFELKFKVAHTFLLTDPVNNNTQGAAIGGSSAEVFSGGDNQLLNFFGFAELDTARDEDDVQLFLDFGDHTNVMRVGNSSAIVVALFEDAITAMEGEMLTLDSHAFGSIFSDGFESGDTSAWSSSSPTRFAVSVSSSDPNVRFKLVPEPSSLVLVMAAILGIAGWMRWSPHNGPTSRP